MVGDELSLIVNLPADVSRILKNPLPALHSEEAGAAAQRGMLGSSAIISSDLLAALQLTPSVVSVAPLALTVVTPLISGLSATYVPYGRASPEAYAPTAEPADADEALKVTGLPTHMILDGRIPDFRGKLLLEARTSIVNIHFHSQYRNNKFTFLCLYGLLSRHTLPSA